MADTTLYPTADSRIMQYYPDDNYGYQTYLSTQTTIGRNDRSFLKFDLNSLPAGAVISLAKLRMWSQSYSSAHPPDTNVEARRVADDSWNEVDPDGINWANQPAYGEVEDTQAVIDEDWTEWIVTPFVVAEFAGDKVVSICCKCVTESYDETTRNNMFHSKEYDNLDPELYIEYTVPPVIRRVCREDIFR